MGTHIISSFIINNSTFTYNSAAQYGGVIVTSSGSSFNINNSTFTNNSVAADSGSGGVMITGDSSFNITGSAFFNNSALAGGGVMFTLSSPFNITNCTFTNNAANLGGVMAAYTCSLFTISGSIFTNNSADGGGGALGAYESSFNITSSTFAHNHAGDGAVIGAFTSSINIINSSFYANKADNPGGIFFNIKCSIHITDGIVSHNTGSLYIFSCNLTFGGYTRIFENSVSITADVGEGGAITSSIQSTVIFTGVSKLTHNQARHGGALLATNSKIIMYGETTFANNTATESSGGGIFLKYSDLEVKGNCVISDNNAIMTGGGIHATSSIIIVNQPWILQFISNRAVNGSGLYLGDSAKVYVLKQTISSSSEYLLIFNNNHAHCGGAIYVADDTNSGACSPDNECFIQTLAVHQESPSHNMLINIIFSGNTATCSEQGANLIG